MRYKDLLFAVGLAMLASPAFGQGIPADQRNQTSVDYNPIINAGDFSHVVSNKYCTLKAGMKAGYEKVTSRGRTIAQIDVAGDTKKVIGVTTLVVRQREWLDGRLLKDARGWAAQDKHGNVWNFGELVEHYQDGNGVSHAGSWEAGVDGAKPGILMFNEPRRGASYRRAYHPGNAEGMATVVAVGVSVTIPQGPSFQNCVHIRESSPLRKRDIEHKYYCVGLGTMVLKEERSSLLKLVTFKESHESQSLRIPRMASAR